MHLHSVSVKNYRSLEDVTLENLERFNVLIGRNNSGKSSVFGALRLFADILQPKSSGGDWTNISTFSEKKRPLEYHFSVSFDLKERREILGHICKESWKHRQDDLLRSPFFQRTRFHFKSSSDNPRLLHLRETHVLGEDNSWFTLQRMTGDENHGVTEFEFVALDEIHSSISPTKLDSSFDVKAGRAPRRQSGHKVGQILGSQQLDLEPRYIIALPMTNGWMEIITTRGFVLIGARRWEKVPPPTRKHCAVSKKGIFSGRMDAPPKFEHGSISQNVTVECATIRVMSDSDEPNQETRLQGRIKNICAFVLDEVKCDLSYFDPKGKFLGLDMTSYANIDEIDSGETAPFDLQVKIPIDATRCVLNVHSKRILKDIAVALTDYMSNQK